MADLGFARVDGGSGTDLLRLLASGNVDLTTLVPRVQSIERIDLAGTAGGTTLMVGAADAIALSEAGDTLLVRGQASDVVAFDVADGFQAAGSESRGGTIFDAFVSGPARVLVQRGVAVTGVNTPPAAMADSASTGENAMIAIDVLANDGDPGDVLTVSVGAAASASGAGLSVVMNQVVYDPGTAFDFLRAGETASDTFTYTISDAVGATASATVTVSVNGQNDAPAAAADSVSTSENAAVSIDVLANDSDRDAGDTLTVTVGQASVGGASLSVVANQVVYDPGTSFDFLRDGETASDTFTYTINDADGATASAVVTVTVTGDPLGDLGALDAHDGFGSTAHFHMTSLAPPSRVLATSTATGSRI